MYEVIMSSCNPCCVRWKIGYMCMLKFVIKKFGIFIKSNCSNRKFIMKPYPRYDNAKGEGCVL